MIGIVLIVVLVLAVGSRVTDGVRLRQQEAILAKLSQAEAIGFYKILRRRMWKVHVLRAITLLSLFAILYSRNRIHSKPPRAAAPRPAQVSALVTSGSAPSARRFPQEI